MVRSLLLTITAGIIVLIFRRKRNEDNATTKQWGWLFFWSLVTHPLLDLHTTWGTQFLWPLPWKMSYNNIFVVDPLYTVPFMICVGAVMFMRRDSARRRWVNWLGIGISSAYMVFTIVCKRIAIGAIAASLERQHIAHTDFSTRPTPFNSILWTVNVDAGDHYLLGYHSLLDTKPEVEFVRVDKGLEALGPWADHEKVRRLQVLADHNFVVRLQGDTIVFSDLRFGQMGEPGPDKPFVFSYLLIPEALDTRLDETTTASAPPADVSALIKKKNDPEDASHALRVESDPPGPPNGEDIGTLMKELWERGERGMNEERGPKPAFLSIVFFRSAELRHHHEHKGERNSPIAEVHHDVLERLTLEERVGDDDGQEHNDGDDHAMCQAVGPAAIAGNVCVDMSFQFRSERGCGIDARAMLDHRPEEGGEHGSVVREDFVGQS
ncbi:MAG: metal-dependent hydrolase [Flavobacteriales bacterium]|nr:metal-dependent hydrolase [Flavobacteriales bacterium]